MKLAIAALALLASACAYSNPMQPAAVPVSETAPATLQLGATVGTGAQGGTAVLTAKVQNGHGTKLPGIRVQFTSDAGTLSATAAETTADGISSVTLTAASAATVIASAGTVTAKMIVPSLPHIVDPPVSPPDPTDPTDPGPLEVSLTATTVEVGSLTMFSLSVKHGPAQSIAWAYGDGATSVGFSPSSAHLYGAGGTYTASATVTDTRGRSARATTTVTVTAPLPAYTVTVNAVPATVLVDGSATLTATVTRVNGAPDPTSYAWDCNGDGTVDATTNTNIQVCTYPTAGSIGSRVTVTGGTATGTGSVTVTVAGPSYAVELTASQTTLTVYDTATLTATVTRNNGAVEPTSFDWYCTGDTLAANTITNTYICKYTTVTTAITPTVSKVIVRGGTGTGTATGTGTVNMTVNAVAPLAIAVTAVPSGTLAIGQTVTFTATISSTGPVPTSELVWEWDYDGDGTVDTYPTTHTNPDIQTTNYGSAGVKTLKVKVTHTPTLRTATGTRTVTVVTP